MGRDGTRATLPRVPKLVVLLEQLLAPVPGGTGRYSRELTTALAATAPAGWTVGSALARHTDPTPAIIPGVEGPQMLPLPRRPYWFERYRRRPLRDASEARGG